MQPNTLVMFADQMRADGLGCAGHPIVKTPNLDRLAERGVFFENAYTPDPICVPARASFTTGNYPHKSTGTKENRGRIRNDQIKIAQFSQITGISPMHLENCITFRTPHRANRDWFMDFKRLHWPNRGGYSRNTIQQAKNRA